MTEFERSYVSTNNKPNALPYDSAFFSKLRAELIARDHSLEPVSYAILASLAIGAHRPDLVPKLFEDSVNVESNETIIRTSFYQFRSVIMVIWPFVGIPWCVPACLGLVNLLKSRGLDSIAKGRTRPDISPEDTVAGEALMKKTYAAVQNDDVREMLRTYFADFSSLTWTVVFGYSLAGTTSTGVFEEKTTQLVLAAAITASGATRQARSHLKASIGMGNSVQAVEAVEETAKKLCNWNGAEFQKMDVEVMAREVASALNVK